MTNELSVIEHAVNLRVLKYQMMHYSLAHLFHGRRPLPHDLNAKLQERLRRPRSRLHPRRLVWVYPKVLVSSRAMVWKHCLNRHALGARNAESLRGVPVRMLCGPQRLVHRKVVNKGNKNIAEKLNKEPVAARYKAK